MKTGMLMSIVAGLVATPALAAPVAVTNGNFEDPMLADGEIGFGAPTGWSAGGTENHAAGSGIFGGVESSDGENVFWQNIGFGPDGSVTSDTVGTLEEGTYTLTVDFLFRTDSVSTDSLPDTEFGLSVDGGTTILGTVGTATDALDVDGTGAVLTRTYTLVVGAGDSNIDSNYVIHFDFTQNGAGSWNQAAFDNVQLDYVPEPGSLAILGLGGLLIARRRRG